MDYQLTQTGIEVQNILDQAPGVIAAADLNTLATTGVFYVTNENNDVSGLLFCFESSSEIGDFYKQIYLNGDGKIIVRAGSLLPLTDEWINYAQLMLDGKVDKRTGYGLSQNDFTDYYKGTIGSLMSDVARLSGNKLGYEFVNELPVATSEVYGKMFFTPGESEGELVSWVYYNGAWQKTGGAGGYTKAETDALLTPIQNALQTIEAVIPSTATSQNKLVDKNYVDNSISTNTANFVGTFNSLTELQAVQNPTNNDYGFVIETDAQGNEYYDRYKYNGTQWLFEYKVESTPFTATQWAAIQSGMTAALVTKLEALPTSQQLTTQLAGKQDTIADLSTIRSNAATAAANTGDKAYDAAAFSGLGRVNLQKNIVEVSGIDKNVLTQAMVNTANTIYVIQYDYDLNGQTITLPAGCVLEFDGGSVKNGTINGEIVIKSAKTKIFEDITFAGHLVSNLQVEWFGAKADGVTDSAPAIRQLIASLPASDVTIEFSNGEYLQGDGSNSVATEFVFSNKKNIRINGNGATIVANPSNTCVVANKGFQFLFCENIVVDGIVYNGNIEERKPAMGDAGSINSQNAFDIRGCKNVVLRDCQALGAVMDGFFISYESNGNELVYSESVTLERCLAEKSYRQGVTIRGGNYGVITDCIIRDIGQTAYSTPPQCGIDIEDGYYNGSNGNKILNTTIADCKGVELSLSAGTRNTLVEGCYIKGSIFHNDNNSPTMITGNIISKCTLSNAAITSHCAGLSLLNNVVDFSDTAGVNGLFFNNLRNFAIETIDKIEGNTFRYNWSPADETYSDGKPTTTRGITLQRPLDFEHNALENFSGTNPITTILSEDLATAVRKFNHNTIRSNYDITPYEGTNIATFTGSGGVIRARVYHDNIVEGQYPNMQEGLFDIFNSPNDLRRYYKFPYLQVKGTTWIYDICLGKFSLLKNPTYIRVKVDENTWHLLTKGSNMNMTYAIEKGTSTADLLYSNMYQDDEGNAHILINSTSGGYFYPVIEVFWNGGAYNQKIGQALHMTRRSKTTADGEKTYTAPTATNIQILSISQADYNNLATKDNNTLYIIV